MKSVVFAIIFILILATSLVKNSTKEIEDKIFMVNENIRPLKLELGDVLLEYNYFRINFIHITCKKLNKRNRR